MLKRVYQGDGITVDYIVRYLWNGWRCIEERLAPTGDQKFIPTPRGVYVHGIGLDEVLQLRNREICAEDDVDSIGADGQGYLTLSVDDVSYVDDALVGETLAIWDADTGVLEFEIQTNNSSGGTMIITLTATTGLGDIDDENDAECCIVFDEKTYHYHTNIQGNVVAMTDADGLVVEEYEYDLYGRLTSATAWEGG